MSYLKHQMQKTIKNITFFTAFLVFSLMISQVKAQNAQYRDVIIHEIMADPSPSVTGLPEVEYIELYNRSNQNFDLSGWTLKDASSTVAVFPDNTFLHAGEYAIVCKASEESLFSSYGQIIPTAKWPTLNNDKDSVVIRNADGDLIDALYYTNNWYQDEIKKKGGYALELINSSLQCSDASNWKASNSASGGTPGSVNSITEDVPDVTPPAIVSYTVVDDSQIRILFSEAVDVVLAENINLYIFSPAIEVVSVQFDSELKEATLVLSDAIQKGIEYELTVFGISDCEGNMIEETKLDIFLGEQAQFNDLIITEIMADPSPPVALPEEEYIEIYNNSSKIIELNGMNFTAGSRTATFTEGQIKPQEYALVVPLTAIDLFQDVPHVIGLDKFPAIANAGADLSLKNAEGDVIFNITFSNSWYETSSKKDGGWSLEMVDITQPCLGAINWKESQDESGGTPARVNSVSDEITDLQPLGVAALEFVSGNIIQLIFSQKLHLEKLDQYHIHIQPEISVADISLIGQNGNIIEVVLDENLKEEIEYTIEVSGFYDCSGVAMEKSTLKLGVPVLAQAGDIIINELLYDPKSGGEDFIELLNISNKTLSLSDLVITREDPLNGIIINQVGLEEYKRLIAPQEYIVLSAKGESIRSHYQTAGVGAFVDVNKFPNYVNDGGVVGLYNKENEFLDRLEYEPKMHFQMLKTTKGVSLERVNPHVSSDERTNWNSAAISIGGATPGYQNSQFLQTVPKGKLSVSPEIFSPDGDGFDDLLGVSYQLDKADYVGAASIYTIDGIPVRKIFDNQTLAQEGFFTWDGLDDKHKKARVGIYIVVLELFDLKGKKELLREKFVLATR